MQRSIGNNNNEDKNNDNHHSTNLRLTPPTNPPDNSRLNSTIGGIYLQPKLKVSQPGDIYEQEADRVAEKVMGMNVSQFYLRSLIECDRWMISPLILQISALVIFLSFQERISH